MTGPLRRLVGLTALALALGLGGCGLPRERLPDRPEIAFDREDRIALRVGHVEAANRYVPPLKPPNVEHDFPVSLAGNLRRWAEERVSAAGGEETARFSVLNASAIGAPDGTVLARVAARLEIVAPGADEKILGVADASAEASALVPPDATAEARDDAYYALEKNLLARFDRAMAQAVRARLGPWLKQERGPTPPLP